MERSDDVMVRQVMKGTEGGGPDDTPIRKPPPTDIRTVSGIWSPTVHSSLGLAMASLDVDNRIAGYYIAEQFLC